MKKGKRIVCLLAIIGLVFSIFPQAFFGQANASAERSWDLYSEKIMAKDTGNLTLELELHGEFKLAKNVQITQEVNGKKYKKTLNDVRVGAENISVRVNHKNEITKININGPTPVDTMRVGIMTTNFASTDHSEIKLSSPTGLEVIDKVANQSFTIAAEEVITFTANSHAVTVKKEDDTELMTTANRLYVKTEEAGKISVDSITRGSVWTPVDPSYRGTFEITSISGGDKLNLINEVDLEDYLLQVVPSEMPASFGLNALKAQAVAARTYALGDYLSDRFAKEGYFVLDSVMSQVYNNTPENAITSQAVKETKGVIMLSNDGSLVDARYYSTSGGYGASKHQVWADGDGSFPGEAVPYLIAQSHTFDPNDSSKMLEINTQDEQEVLSFYKTLSYTGYDGMSPYFRWKIGLSKEELANTINKNLSIRQAADPNFVLTKNEAGEFVSLPIPAEGIGEFNNMYVAKRGDGGNIMELVIEGSTGTYKIIKEYNIRFTIRPMSSDTLGAPVLIHRATAGSEDYTAAPLTNYSILPSAFFSFEFDEENGVTFFGGGNGHGVGMSQYGAAHLGLNEGWAYDHILNAYYPNMSLTDASVLSGSFKK
ncbi:SpoIID/LytB domain-containing protein [Ferdinandcohnia quinoae]|uniref:SpoIID/LytB domain-containing protein n=1 Tax=Fredinandcohnia quinoae TaxID=2918902 RepID=A0AAW5E980_9BACI|nr:SpoIID/LytB domain-containing protein [Fredinandcohnia sp. SECRCQ15]MCH1625946.1 SpoIID/LytB domain-containing protein [Fredinandcohnia sp. SECRCQ15]